MFSEILSAEAFQNEVLLKPGKHSQANPDVTVVTVCFNPLKDGRRELFARNLDSVQNQTGVTVEHVIIDGASTDGTLEFLSKYENKCYDIRILSKPDSGIYDAMNRGIALAKGKYVIFLNSDDYYHRNDGLALSYKALEESDCSFTFAPIVPTGSPLLHRLHRHPERHLHRLFIFPTIPHQSMLYRRSALIEVNGYDPSYRMGGDHDLTLRLIASGHKACFVSKAFVTFSTGGFSTQDPVLKFQSANTDWRKHSFIFHNSSPFHNSTFTSFFLIYNISSTGLDVYFLFVMHTILFSKMCLSFPQRSKRLRFREPRSCIRSRDGQQYFQNTRSCEGILSSQHHKLFFVNIYNRESL